jgi:hypothetical protein
MAACVAFVKKKSVLVSTSVFVKKNVFAIAFRKFFWLANWYLPFW